MLELLNPGNYSYNLYSLLLDLTTAAMMLLGTAVLLHERGARVSVTFFTVALAISVWLFSSARLYQATDPTVALVWAKLMHLGFPFVPVACYQFTATVLGISAERRSLLRLLWVATAAFVLVAVGSDEVVRGLYAYSWGNYPRYGLRSIPFIAIFAGILCASLYEYIRAYDKTPPGLHQRRIRWLMVAFGIGYLSLVDFLAAFGLAVYPFGHLTIFLFVLVAFHTIRRYRLADISPSFVANQLVSTMGEPMVVCDADQTIQLVNRAFCDVFGYLEPELLGKPLLDIVPATPAARMQLSMILRHWIVRDEEMLFSTRNNKPIEVSVSISQMHERGHLVGTVLVARDIRERKRAEAQLLHDAFHDGLTGLPNRALFLDRLTQVFRRQQRRDNSGYAVLFIDLDRFKLVNDSLGHLMGDQLLIGIAHRMEECLRPADTIARLGGDEFAVLLEDIESASDATRIAERVQEAMSSPFLLAEQEVFASVSVGISLGMPTHQRPEELLRDADIAMYRAKSLGRARHHIFDPTMHARATEQFQLETDLRRALARQEFRLHYQPIVNLATGSIAGFEALVRWQHPSGRLIPPAQFIPIAEETGLIVPLGSWILQEACRQMSAWHRSFPHTLPMTISVNLSGKQLTQPDLPEQIADVLRENNLDACYLKLEITESMLIENTEAASEILARLRALGIQLQMDDFGTGYSSLSYLHRFPMDSIKIDRSFISGLDGVSEQAAIVQAIVTLAHALGLSVVAEGVETAAHLQYLKPLACEFGQGYFFSRPLPLDAVEDLLQQPVPLAQLTPHP